MMKLSSGNFYFEILVNFSHITGETSVSQLNLAKAQSKWLEQKLFRHIANREPLLRHMLLVVEHFVSTGTVSDLQYATALIG